jgi:hypothetical protein
MLLPNGILQHRTELVVADKQQLNVLKTPFSDF